MESLYQKLGPQAMARDLVELGVEDILQYNPYEDRSQNVQMFPILDKEPQVNPEWGGQYVNAEILLLRVDRMARDQVVHQKQDAENNPIGRSNQSPIFDTCLYTVEFFEGEIKKLAANIIAESMYAQCDVNGNKYLLLEAFADHRKNGSPLNVENQRKVVKGQETLRK